jgi:cell division protein ZapE
MTPKEFYTSKVQTGEIVSDADQLSALSYFETIYADLIAEDQKRKGILAAFRAPKSVKGLYLYGGVGIGKTFLMDCFFKTLPFNEKMRMHFHQFMQYIHDLLTQHQGEKDPLTIIANDLSKKVMVICFDEFFVSDITDAMLLGRLFKQLFAKGVCLVSTSNTEPDNLYKNGLQRSQFLPAIALLKKQTDVVYIPSSVDYRLRHLNSAGVFYTPLNQAAADNMAKTFEVLAEDPINENDVIKINDRPIHFIKQCGKNIWFDFNELCKIPRSQKDYLDISKQFSVVFISNIPVIQSREKDKICLFINLIDVFYDARIKVIISAEKPVNELYSKGYKTMEYTRTQSRLLEMQSRDYFS